MTEIKCATCRYYAYLTTLSVHLCHLPEAGGEISEQEVENVTKYGCDGWEPREANL